MKDFLASSSCNGYIENNIFAVTIASTQKTQIGGFILCMYVSILNKSWESEQSQQVVFEEKCCYH